MGDENRGSSGGGTGMVVAAILVGLLLVGCSCGGIILGGGFLLYGSARNVEMEAVRARDQAQEDMDAANQEMQHVQEKIRQEMEAIKLPEPPQVPTPDSSPVSAPPAEEK